MNSNEVEEFHRLPVVNKAKKLTDHGNGITADLLDVLFLNCVLTGWLLIRDECMAFVQRCQTRRNNEERVRVIGHRVGVLRDAVESLYKPPTLPPRSAWDPRLGDIAMFPEVRAIIELPNEAEILPDTFASVIQDLPILSIRWRDECKVALGENLRKSYQRFLLQLEDTADAAWTEAEIDTMENVDLVDLAASVLECRFCHCTMEFLLVVIHRCAYNKVHFVMSDVYLLGLHSILPSPWSASQFRTEVAHIPRLHRVASLLGVDWKIATSKALDNCDRWFVCTCERCQAMSHRSGVQALKWRNVVSRSACILYG